MARPFREIRHKPHPILPTGRSDHPIPSSHSAKRSCDLQNAVVTKVPHKSLQGNNSFLIND